MSLRLLGVPPRGPVAFHPGARRLPLGRRHRPTRWRRLPCTSRTTDVPPDGTHGLLKRRNLPLEVRALRLQFRQSRPKSLSNVGHESSSSCLCFLHRHVSVRQARVPPYHHRRALTWAAHLTTCRARGSADRAEPVRDRGTRGDGVADAAGHRPGVQAATASENSHTVTSPRRTRAWL